MPKMKSHSGAKKRFIVTKRKKIKYKQQGLRHLLTGMKSSRGRKLRRARILHPLNETQMKKLLPYEF
jgi:ribosomal protein L35